MLRRRSSVRRESASVAAEAFGGGAVGAWAAAGVWEKVFADLIKDRDNQYLMLDSTLVRAHQQATTGRGSGQKRGASIRLWGVPEVD